MYRVFTLYIRAPDGLTLQMWNGTLHELNRDKYPPASRSPIGECSSCSIGPHGTGRSLFLVSSGRLAVLIGIGSRTVVYQTSGWPCVMQQARAAKGKHFHEDDYGLAG